MTIPDEVDEAVLLHALRRDFERAAPLGERTAGPRPDGRPRRGSALADDARTGPHRLSHSAHHALVVAVDHLQALAALMSGTENDGHREMPLPTHAPFTLLRAALENAARAVRLLAPASRRERVHRCLRMHLAGLKSSEAKATLLGHALEGRQERQERVKDLLCAAGIPQSELSNGKLKMPGYGDIVRTAGTHTPGGGEHARAVLDRETMATDGDVSWIRSTGSTKAALVITDLAIGMAESAFALYTTRARVPCL
ncbi:hypothetical protein [Kitasatospora sp. NPDC057500]|uniref:hypothetical protein n=1 Tax=Kitasatospora sp. NPDC057500 TaxID=3346151 RepID=UPI0036C8309C